MKCSKWLVGIFISILIALACIPSSIANADSPSIDSVRVFQNYAQTGDWLIVCVYNISAPTDCEPYNFPWNLNLIVNGGVFAPMLNIQCGMRPSSIYLGPNMVSSLQWGGNYTLEINGTVAGNASYQLHPADWIGYNPVEFLKWVIFEAQVIGAYDTGNASYYLAQGGNPPVNVLNDQGSAMFTAINAIPQLNWYLKDAFQYTVVNVTSNYTYQGAPPYAVNTYNSWSSTIGAPLSNALNAIGQYFGISGHLAGALMVMLGFLCLAVTGDMTISVLILLGGAVIGLIPMDDIFVMVFLLAIVFVRAFFWSST